MRLHLALFLEDGTEVLSSFGGEPLALRIGDGTLAPGLEDLLLGLAAGAEERMLADGASVYGRPDPALVHSVPRSDLPADFEAVPGQVVNFAAPNGEETPATVLDEEADGVRIDFNHPLARRGLRIEVRILAVG